jgi:hypothetical protein
MSNNNGRENWDPHSFQLDADSPAPKPPNRKGRRVSSIRGKFVAGPIDAIWLSHARDLGVTALWVGLGLWYLRGLKRSDTFVVSNMMMQEWGVLPDAKGRALRKLQAAGLITMEQKGKRSPCVTLVIKKQSGDGMGR